MAAPSTADIRAEAIKLLPKPAIASAPPPAPKGLPLVNIDIIFWLQTDNGYQSLGSANLVGQNVEFRAQINTVQWNFGDGGSATSHGAGRSYDLATNPCHTARCPGYFTHVYTRKGSVTVSSNATWTAQFRVNNGAWTTIGDVTAPAGALNLTIREARTVLVDH